MAEFWKGPLYADGPHQHAVVAWYRERQAEQAERAAARPKRPVLAGVRIACPPGATLYAKGPRGARRYGAVKAHAPTAHVVEALGLIHFGLIRADRIKRLKKVNEPFRVTEPGDDKTPWRAERVESQPEA